jgi:hypothetical protein
MKEDTQIDWSKTEDILTAAIPFDRSYSPERPVMLAGSELVAFVRHHMSQRFSAGRRFSDVYNADRIKALESRMELLEAEKRMLEAENLLFLSRLRKDRRQKDNPVEVDRRK